MDLSAYITEGGRKEFLYDPYFRFDSHQIADKGWENIIGHPLMKFFLKPFTIIGDVISSSLETKKAKTIFLVMCTISLISMSVVYVYRYLKSVINLIGPIVWILTVFYGFFSTNLILSFTFESFTFSAFLLSLSVCFYSVAMKEGEEVPPLTNALFIFSLGGITVTNILKGFIPVFFTTKDTTKAITKIVVIGILFTITSIYFLYQYYNRADFGDERMALASGELNGRITSFSDSILTTKSSLIQIFNSFFGEPILMPPSKIGMSLDFYLTKYNIYHPIILSDVYTSWCQQIFVVILCSLLCIAVVMNYKNKFVIYLFLLFMVDIMIHLIVGYGITEGFFLYGGHWVYLVPLFLGWLYKKLNSTKTKCSFVVVLLGLMIVLMVNNFIYMKEFTNLALEYFSMDEWLHQ